MSKKQLAEQRKYDILESELEKEPKPERKNGNWYQEYCRKYEALCQRVKEGK